MIYEIEKNKNSEFMERHLHLGGKNGREEIEINNRYLKKNGIPWIPVIGEMHYLRVPEEHWEEELNKMRAGGITVVSSYIMWLYHEQNENQFCFTGRRNLKKFVETAEKCGLSVILRIGPWVHGEVRNGGFPDWLLQKEIPLRQNHPEYLKYVKRYFEKIYEQVKDDLFYKDGSIWGIQLENELTDQPEHLHTLRKMAEEIGLCVPVYTVTGWNSKYGAQVPEYDVLPVFGGYPEAPWENHKEKLLPNLHYFFLPARNDSSIGNDLLPQKLEEDRVFWMNYGLYPFATCELGGGVPSMYRRRPHLGPDDISSIAMVKLGCGNNMPGYYMYKGGINDLTDITMQESKETGYPNDCPIRNYDFQAPLGAYGDIRKPWRKLKVINLFLEAFGTLLAPMDACFQKDPITDREDMTKLRYSIRTDGKGGFLFVNNFQRLDSLPEHKNVQFKVPCANGELLFPKNGLRVPTGSYFFFPYYLKADDILIKYATAQLLYKLDHTLFFFSIPGIDPEYCIRREDGSEEIVRPNESDRIIRIENAQGNDLHIITLSMEEAEHFYPSGKTVYIPENADIYRQNNQLIAQTEGDFRVSCKIWNGRAFFTRQYEATEYPKVTVGIKEIEKRELKKKAEIRRICEKELFLGGTKRIKGWQLELPDTGESQEMFIEIEYIGDVLQIYSGDILITDEFYRGVPFRAKVRDLMKYGTSLELWISELKEGDCYLETSEREGLQLKEVTLIPIYHVKLE